MDNERTIQNEKIYTAQLALDTENPTSEQVGSYLPQKLIPEVPLELAANLLFLHLKNAKAQNKSKNQEN